MNTPQHQNLVNWAHWAEANKSHFIYTEGAQRMEAIGQWPLKFPISCDCSGFVTLLCNLAGLPDPNGQDVGAVNLDDDSGVNASTSAVDN